MKHGSNTDADAWRVRVQPCFLGGYCRLAHASRGPAVPAHKPEAQPRDVGAIQARSASEGQRAPGRGTGTEGIVVALG
jgi:hypothetical protein